MPHGILFRGEAERDIRKGSCRTTCWRPSSGLRRTCSTGLASRPASSFFAPKAASLPKRRGNALFINADVEYQAGRAQNYLLPEHVEIANGFERYENIPGFATVVPISELERNDWNQNIRGYADNAPPPEPPTHPSVVKMPAKATMCERVPFSRVVITYLKEQQTMQPRSGCR